jgi:ankyrin repeat protein
MSEDFANNLFTDLGPLIALFGEQVTKQFLSQSLGFEDDVLFAIAPLGILTGVVSAIRTGGPRWLRAVVGRSLESRITSSMELTSATSSDICELWDGKNIVRLQGSPKILTVLYKIEDQDLIENTATSNEGAHTRIADFEQAISEEWIRNETEKARKRTNRNTESWEQDEEETWMLDRRPLQMVRRIPQIPPNLTLNAMGRPSRNLLRLAMLSALLVQLSVFGFSAWVTYSSQKESTNTYAYPLYLIGSVGMLIGLIICSSLVRSSCIQEDWYRDYSDSKLPVVWLQQAQKLNDQSFGSYAIRCSDLSIKSLYTNESLAKNRGTTVVIATSVTMAGFICQFIGLRSLDWSSSIGQLIAMAIATLLRVMMRMQFSKEADATSLPLHFELEWATQLVFRYKDFHLGFPIDPNSPSPGRTDFIVAPILNGRIKLGQMGQEAAWELPFSSTLSELKLTIECIINHFWRSPQCHLKSGLCDKSELVWPLKVSVSRSAPGELVWDFHPDVSVSFKRYKIGREWTDWKVDGERLEAVFLLWIYQQYIELSAKEAPEFSVLEPRPFIWSLCPLTPTSCMDFDFWIHRGSSYFEIPHTSELIFVKDDQIGVQSPLCEVRDAFPCLWPSNAVQDMAVKTYCSFPELLAKVMISGFLNFICAHAIKNIESSPTFDQDAHSPRFLFQDVSINNVVVSTSKNGLLTPREAFLILIPTLRTSDLLPDLTESVKVVIPSKILDSNMGLYLSLLRYYRHRPSLLESDRLRQTLDKVLPQIANTAPSRTSASIYQLAEYMFKISQNSLDFIKEGPDRTTQKAFLDLLDSDQFCVGDIPLNDKNWLWYADVCLAKGVIQRFGAFAFHRLLRLAVENNSWSLLALVLTEASDLHIRKSLDVNITDLLYIALTKGHCDMVFPLLENPRWLIHDVYVHNPLVAAASYKDDEMIKSLISSQSFSPYKFDLNGDHAIREAIKCGNYKNYSCLIGPESLGLRLGEIDMLLEAAVLGQNADILRDVLKLRSQMQQRYVFQSLIHLIGQPSIPLLPDKGLTESLRPLYRQMTEIPIRSRNRLLQIAAEGGRTEMVLFLIKSGANVNAFAKPGKLNCLQSAARFGHLDCVETLLLAGADVDSFIAADGGLTPLQAAALGGHANIVHRLLEIGADSMALPSRNGYTLLQAAAASGNHDLYRFLVGEELLTKENYYSKHGRTLLQAACESKNLDMVEEILALQPSAINIPASNNGGKTALQIAAAVGSIDIVQMLLKDGAQINADPALYRGRTALQAAAEVANLDMCILLLSMGADVNALPSDHNGLTALQAACKSSDIELVKYLCEHNADIHAPAALFGGRTALQAAAENYDYVIVEFLLKTGAYFNERPAFRDGICTRDYINPKYFPYIDIPPWTMIEKHETRDHKELANSSGSNSSLARQLQVACSSGNIALLAKLQEEGTNTVPKEALVSAAENGHEMVFSRIFWYSAYDQIEPLQGRNALEGAAMNGHHYIVEDLLNSRMTAERGRQIETDSTALQLASHNGHLPVVLILLERGAVANAEPCKFGGLTALQGAALGGHVRVMKALLDVGADVHAAAADMGGMTAIEAAIESGNEQAIALVEHYLSMPRRTSNHSDSSSVYLAGRGTPDSRATMESDQLST